MAPNIYEAFGYSSQEEYDEARRRLDKLPLKVAASIMQTAYHTGYPVLTILEAIDQVNNAFAEWQSSLPVAADAGLGTGGLLGALRRILGRVVGAHRLFTPIKDTAGTQYRISLGFWDVKYEEQTIRNLPLFWKQWGYVGVRIGDMRYGLVFNNPWVLNR